MKLSQSEEEVMHHIWSLKRAYLKDILNAYDDPKPAVTTIATLLKRMIDKGYVAFETHGKARLYAPLVRKEEYFSKHFDNLLKSFFGNSASQFASFFTKSSNFSNDELKELRSIIDKQISKQSPKE